MAKQRKLGRPRSENPMKHTAVVLPREMVDRLANDARKLGHGLSTEIRQRLQLTFDREMPPKDLETDELLKAIKLLADNLAGDLGKKWHEHPYALAAFKAGVAAFLQQYKPEGDESVRPDTRVVGETEDPPDIVGRTHARLIWVAQRLG